MGDFSVLPELPRMYAHCKATEDKDMTPFDFVTDHLLDIDGIFDKHDNGDEQKPHTPVQFQHNNTLLKFVNQIPPITLVKQAHVVITFIKYIPGFRIHHYIAYVFRPPVV